MTETFICLGIGFPDNRFFDPWSAGGVSVNNSAAGVWSIMIPNGAHHLDLMCVARYYLFSALLINPCCRNLYPPQKIILTMNSVRFSDPRDPADVTAARRFEVAQIKSWVADYLTTRTVQEV